MKRITLLALLAGLLTATGTMAQTTSTTTTVTTDTTAFRDYVGKYAMTGASFETVIITVENGKLVGEAVGAGKGELVADEKTPDTFKAPDYDVTITFPREADKKVNKIKMAMQGQEFTGQKQP